MIILSKNQIDLIDEIDRSVSVNPRFKKQEKKAHFRASEVGYFCARKFALEKLFPARGDSAPSLASVIPLVLGSGIHHGLQNELLSDMLLGRWKCNECGQETKTNKLTAKPIECNYSVFNSHGLLVGECGSTDFTYIEETLAETEGLIAGHPDGYLKLKSGEVVLLEVKTIGLGPHKSLDKGPLEAHVLQANTYLHLGQMRHSNECAEFERGERKLADIFPDVMRCVILYVIKHEHGLRVFRQFTIEYNSAAIEETLAKLREAAKFKKGDTLPERICDSEKCKTAKYCPMTRLCFSVT